MSNQTFNLEDLAQATAFDVDGDKLGSVGDIYINDTTGQPDFIEVNHGLFNMSSSIVPLRGHALAEGELKLAFSKDRIKDAPNLDTEDHISDEQRQEFFRHYGVESAADQAQYAAPKQAAPAQGAAAGNESAGVAAGAAGAAGAAATDESAEAAQEKAAAPRHAATDTEMIRSEERLNVDKNVEETGNVTLRKYVVHDTETVEVPVEREEVRVERQPISEEEAQNLRGQEISEGEASVTLHEERVTVSKESVPVEKVSLEKDTIQDSQTVTEDVAKERIEADHEGQK